MVLWYTHNNYSDFRRPVSIPDVVCDDENVDREERKVGEGETERDILTLKELTKVYDQCSLRGNSRVAVNKLHLSMKPSEVCVCVCLFVSVTHELRTPL